MPDFDRAPWPDIGRFISGTAVPIVIIVAFAWVFLLVAERFLDGLIRRLIVREAAEGTARALSATEVQRRIDTVTALLVSLLRVLVLTIAVIMVLGKFNVDVGPAVAGLGIVGIAVGFGAQSLVKDFFNGVLILVENQFVKGDVIRVAGVSGTVEDFTLRRTTLRDGEGVVHSVPNGEIAVSSNLTRMWAMTAATTPAAPAPPAAPPSPAPPPPPAPTPQAAPPPPDPPAAAGLSPDDPEPSAG